MNLMLKLYHDKPSKIAVHYNYEHQAQRAYEDLLTKHAGLKTKIKIELLHHKITLCLESVESGFKMYYKDLDYRSSQILQLKAYYEAGSALNFVHVFSKQNTLFVAKPFYKPNFLSVESIELIGAFQAGY